MKILLESTVTCPECGHKAKEGDAHNGVPVFLRMQELQNAAKNQKKAIVAFIVHMELLLAHQSKKVQVVVIRLDKSLKAQVVNGFTPTSSSATEPRSISLTTPRPHQQKQLPTW